MKAKVVINAWNDLPIPDGYSKEEYEEVTKAGWELLLHILLMKNNPNQDKFKIESVEIQE